MEKDKEQIEVEVAEDASSPSQSQDKEAEETEVKKTKEDDGWEGLEDEEKALLGKRAQKRIKGLLAKSKTLEDKLNQAFQEIQVLKEKETAAVSNAAVQETQAVKEHEERLNTLEAQAKELFKKAAEAGDVDAQTQAMESLAEVKAEKQVLATYKRRAQNVMDKKTVQPQRQMAPPPPSKKTLDWVKNNEWMMGAAPKERLMQQYAVRISEEGIAGGLDPDSDEYFEYIDEQMRDEFPSHFKKEVSVQKQTGVVGGSNKAASSVKMVNGKRVITLTADEKRTAERLGISLEAYAKQKIALEGQI